MEERRKSEQRDKPFYVHSLMLIAYWVIIILFVLNSESIQYRILRYTGIVQFNWYYNSMQCIRFGDLQITWYYQVPWANPVPE